MVLTEIDLSKNAKDATLTPAKISTNPADNFLFPAKVTASSLQINGGATVTGQFVGGPSSQFIGDLQILGHVETNFITGNTGSPLILKAFSNSTTAIQLQGSTGTVVLNIDSTNNRVNVPTIGDTTGAIAVDVNNRSLKDSANVLALDWLNRLLAASDGTTSINFNTPGTVDFLTSLDMNGNSIINLAAPVNPNDAANKTYVDTVAQGLLTKSACLAATTAALTPVTAAGSGVGKTLTEVANGLLTVDGVSVWIDVVNNGGSTNPVGTNPASRVLVKDQVNPIDNGIYCVTNKGSAGTPFVLTRAIDFDGSPANEVVPGDFTFIGEGTINASSGWTVGGTNNPVVVDTDPIPFTQFSGAGQIIAGNGLTKTGNQLDVAPSDASLTVSVGNINVRRDPAGAITLSGAGIAVNPGNGLSIVGNAIGIAAPVSIANGGTNTNSQVTNGVTYFDGTKITSASTLSTNGTNLTVNGQVNTDTVQGRTSNLILNPSVSTQNVLIGGTQVHFGVSDLAFYDDPSRTLHLNNINTVGDINVGANFFAGQIQVDEVTARTANLQLNPVAAGGLIKFGWAPGFGPTIAQIVTATNTLDMLTHNIINLANPVNPQDAATKAYIDGGSHTVASPASSVQFNNAGSFGGSANLTWDNTNSRLGIGTATPSDSLTVFGTNSNLVKLTGADGASTNLTAPGLTLTSGNLSGGGSTSTTGGTLTLTSGNTTGTTSQGGSILLTSGTGFACAGGGVTLTSGAVAGGGSATGGSVLLTTGNASGPTSDNIGGSITLSTGNITGSGSGHSTRGGSITLTSGTYSTGGGCIGGGITLTSGTASGGGGFSQGGSILLTSGGGGSQPDSGGNLTLTSATAANGGSIVLSGTGANGTSGSPAHGNIYANNVNASTSVVVGTTTLTNDHLQGDNSGILTIDTAFNTNTGDSTGININPGGIGTGLFSAGTLTLAGGPGVGGGQAASLILSGWNGNDHSLSPSNATLNCGGGDGTSPGNFIIKSGGTETARFTNAHTLGIGNASPDASALVDLTSTTKGFLPPRMTTTQKNAIATPATGLIVYDTTLGFLQEYNGTSWTSVSPASAPVIVTSVSTTTVLVASTTQLQNVLADTTAGSFSVTLPSAATANQQITIKKVDVSANTVTIQANGSETIDGSNTQSLIVQWQSLTMVSNGTSWFII